jgi:hypothetical protein
VARALGSELGWDGPRMQREADAFVAEAASEGLVVN